jgi:hypothetical protein
MHACDNDSAANGCKNSGAKVSKDAVNTRDGG